MGGMELPPGPREPAALQTVEWVARPTAFLRRCRAGHGDPFTVRMESWLPGDTFRRAGFGRIVRGRQPVLTVERGLSLVWFRPDGSPAVVYAAGLYAVRPRFRIPAQTERFALCSNSCASPLQY